MSRWLWGAVGLLLAMAVGEVRGMMGERMLSMRERQPMRRGCDARDVLLCFHSAAPGMFVARIRRGGALGCRRRISVCMQQTVDNEDQVKQARKKPKQQERSTGEDRRMRLRAWMASQDADAVLLACFLA